jgi:hypothetical protein
MTDLCIKLADSQGNILFSSSGENQTALVCGREYEEGDRILFSSSKFPVYLVIQVDDAMGEDIVYLTCPETVYRIPMGEKRKSYSPKAFCGKLHLITAREAAAEEVHTYRNLAKNGTDQHDPSGRYPHAAANVETRGEAVFEARNAIDGVKANTSHGEWPYQSWGIGGRADAQFELHFGRKVIVDKIVLYTRADFPHDNWWRQVTVTFSDGTSLLWGMEKSALPHEKKIEGKEISWLRLSNLIKADDPSPFPALTEIEVYGVDWRESL